MHEILNDLNWRYATKRFDPSQKLDAKRLEIIREALRLTPSSYGLQAVKYLIIESPEMREELLAASYGQRPVVDASHLLVLCAYREVNPVHIDEYTSNVARTRDLQESAVEGYSKFLKTNIGSLSPEETSSWTSRQVYIALGQLLTVCAHLHVDALPMEGFNKKAYDKILGLEAKNLTAVLACPIGFRHPEDPAQFQAKVRKSLEDLFETI